MMITIKMIFALILLLYRSKAVTIDMYKKQNRPHDCADSKEPHDLHMKPVPDILTRNQHHARHQHRSGKDNDRHNLVALFNKLQLPHFFCMASSLVMRGCCFLGRRAAPPDFGARFAGGLFGAEPLFFVAPYIIPLFSHPQAGKTGPLLFVMLIFLLPHTEALLPGPHTGAFSSADIR